MSVRANLAGLLHRMRDWLEPRKDILRFVFTLTPMRASL
jgi:hypothetical protein